ncbi:MAG: hypothetical protein KGI00_01735 [Candidatus Micrarchaeota archaeon]|nr:hypothetical protein [Candidatus Micrarchaeota archaeon]MDE1824180.1 hypothetical protein [Candidatus Micrarchaeota archaeon]MDE1849429.1 hypothetical protein [Candidatus Micrarchaeota archaeon]
METGSIIFYVVLIVVIASIVYLLYDLFSHPQQKRSTTAQVPAPTSPTGPSPNPSAANVSFYSLNVQYVYSGPPTKNGVQCSYNSYTYVDTSQVQSMNGLAAFYLNLQPSSNDCGLTITNITNYTAGFRVTSVEPTLPIDLPPNSQILLQINMRAPGRSFYGPLTITVHYK